MKKEKVTLVSKSFVGRRDYNQDNCCAKKIKEGIYFLAVADGMGGTSGGGIASQLVLDGALKIIKEEYESDVLPEEMKEILERIFLSAQKIIAEHINKEPHLAGMGTTLTCLLIHNDKYAWANIGDSRIYKLLNGDIEQITIDHSYVQDYLKDSNEALPASVLKKYGNYLKKALDGGSDNADIFPKDKEFYSIKEEDIFLLCSDGLITDKILGNNTIIRDYILSSRNLKDAAEQLIALAFHSGSTDNISVVLASFGTYNKEKIKVQRIVYPPSENSSNTLMNRIKLPKLSSIIATAIVLFGILLAYLIGTKPNQKPITKILNPLAKEKDQINKLNYETLNKNKKDLRKTDTADKKIENHSLTPIVVKESKQNMVNNLQKGKDDTEKNVDGSIKDGNMSIAIISNEAKVKNLILKGNKFEKEGNYSRAIETYYYAFQLADSSNKKLKMEAEKFRKNAMSKYNKIKKAKIR